MTINDRQLRQLRKTVRSAMNLLREVDAELTLWMDGVPTPAPEPEPPTPAPSDPPWLPPITNEPPGFAPITDRDFEALVEHGWTADVSNPLLSLVVDPTAPGGEKPVGRIRWPAGTIGGQKPDVPWTEREISARGVTSLYVSFGLKVSANWQSHPINDKILYIWTHGQPVVYLAYVGGGSNPLSTQIRLQGTVPEDDVWIGEHNKLHLRPNLADVEIVRGQWHRWEIVLVSNTGRNADGEAHWWIDGQKVGEHLGVRFGDETHDKRWNIVAWRPIWGGLGGVVEQEQYEWMDSIYVSGK